MGRPERDYPTSPHEEGGPALAPAGEIALHSECPSENCSVAGDVLDAQVDFRLAQMVGDIGEKPPEDLQPARLSPATDVTHFVESTGPSRLAKSRNHCEETRAGAWAHPPVLVLLPRK